MLTEKLSVGADFTFNAVSFGMFTGGTPAMFCAPLMLDTGTILLGGT